MTASTACASGCSRPAPGATLCTACTGELRRTLELAASIAPDLDDAIARQLKRGHGGKRTDSESPLPINLAASDAAARLRVTMGAVVGRISYPHPRWPDGVEHTISSIACYLAGHVAAIAAHADAGEMNDAISGAVARCVMVLEPPPDRVYAGPCPQCGYDVLGYPGFQFADCDRCRTMVDVPQRQAAMRAAMEDMLGGAAWCARMAGQLGAVVSENTVYSWVRRAQLLSHGDRVPDRGGDPQPVYRLGDVLDLIARSPRKVSR